MADSGKGVPREAQALIFERLYQERSQAKEGRKGLGLGLYICSEIARRQGGRIWVESEPGKGSRFYFTVPRFSYAKALAPILAEASPSSELFLVQCRVLAPGHGLSQMDAARVRTDACDILVADAGPQGLLLPDTAPTEAAGPLYLALCGGRSDAEARAKAIELDLATLSKLRESGLRAAARVVAVLCAHGTAEELEREIEGIISKGLAPLPEREEPYACPSA